jgi:hypothetical protein
MYRPEAKISASEHEPLKAGVISQESNRESPN